jgi:hypothetical protein
MTEIKQFLAAYGIDAAELTVYAGGQYACIQRDPQPNEADIRIDTSVQLMIVNLDDTDSFDFEIWIEASRILSYVSSVATWEDGWSGTVDTNAVDDPFTFCQVTAQQPDPTPFVGEQVVTVRVIVTPGATPDLDVSYDFTIEDITPPSLLSAQAIDAFTIRLTFDDNMAVSGPGSALNASAYTITRHNVDPEPGVNLNVTGVTEVPGSNAMQFDATVHWEQTPGCSYEVEVSEQVTDSSGNGVQ